MNRTRLMIGLGVAIVLGLFASTFVYRQVARMAAGNPVTAIQIVVAAVHLPLGTRLEPQQLKLISWPSDKPIPGMFTRIEDCVNRAVIAPVTENEPILEGKLARKEGGAGLSVAIPEGMRALSVAVNEVVGVAGFVLPGTTVDVLATGSPVGRGSESVTLTILQNVRVLAAGQKVEQDKDGKPQTVTVVTLLVTPEDANRLTMAASQGKIQLALRNTIDSKKANPPPVLETNLFAFGPAAPPKRAAAPKAAPAPPPAPPVVVEIINGNKREMKSFPNP
jgi:pilus assembly protein CpaB